MRDTLRKSSLLVQSSCSMMTTTQHDNGGSPTMTSIFRRIPSVRERTRRSSLGQVSGGVAIHDAIVKGKLHLAKFILDAVESQSVVNSRDTHGKTPLFRAIRLEDSGTRAKAISLLIQHGASVNHRDNLGRTTLSYAAEARSNDVIKILVKNNVDPNLDDTNGNTPLMYCALVGNTDGAAILTKSFRRLGLEVDKMNTEGMTALMVAAQKGFMDCVKLLIVEGRASLDLRDKVRNMTAADWAKEGGCSNVDLEVFLPKIYRQVKSSDSTPSTPILEPRSTLQKNGSQDSNCSSKDGCYSSKHSSGEDLSHKMDSPIGLIAIPTPPSHRRNTQPHSMDTLSRRFHALHPVKNVGDIPCMKQLSDMKRASLPEATDTNVLKIHCDDNKVGDPTADSPQRNRKSPVRPATSTTVFMKRPKPCIVQRRPLSATNRQSTNRQSRSFDGVSCDRESIDELRPDEKMSKSHSMNHLGGNLLTLTFLSRSTEVLSPIRSRSNCASPCIKDTLTAQSRVNSMTKVQVNVDQDLRTLGHFSDNTLKVDTNEQNELTPRLPPLTPKHNSKGY